MAARPCGISRREERKPIRLTKDQASGPVTELLSLYRRWRVAQAFPFGISAIRGARPAMLRPRTVARIAEKTGLTASAFTSSSMTRSPAHSSEERRGGKEGG